MRSNTKKIVVNALLLGIGAILHQITPAMGLPMQPDFALCMLFIIVLINKGHYQTCLASAIVTGLFAAITTKFPGGQLPNVIDKVITIHIVVLLYYFIERIFKENKNTKILFVKSIIIFSIGTICSGSIFLISAIFLVGLPAPFTVLFLTVVVPSLILNSITGVFLLNLIKRITRGTMLAMK